MLNFKDLIFIIFINFVFLFYYTKETLANQDLVFSKIKELKIEKRFDQKKVINKEEEIKKEKSKKEVKKQTFEELQRREIIPDVIISIDPEKVKEENLNQLFNTLKTLKNEGRKIDYFSTNNIKGIYIYIYNSKDKLKNLKEQNLSEGIKISENRKLTKQYTPNAVSYTHLTLPTIYSV